ncbi:MAG: S-layer homology domain-containing protein [Bacillota bacterium]|uniref:S-layer homology domain-containing protein n=1 Tax=Desulfitibacter alkalitolerans TaxID=264641 RepID=UPI0004820B1E|nr:S-layer homology domain-containing protein [Desulfitibacter alkalitolerans]
MKLMRMTIAILLIVALSTQVFAAQNIKLDFPDIKGHWAEDHIRDFTAKEIIKGYPDGTFKPERNISRAEFASLMFRLLKLKNSTDNKDRIIMNEFESSWAKDSLEALVDNGIIDLSEYQNGYDVNGAITRLEIAKMIIRSLEKDLVAKNLKSSTGFKDDNIIKDGDKGYVLLAKRYEIIAGYEDGTFRPDNPATRAETVKMLSKRDDAVNIIKKENSSSSSPKAVIDFKLPEYTHTDKTVEFDWTARNAKSLSWSLEKSNEDDVMSPVDLNQYADLMTEGDAGQIQFKDKGIYSLVVSARNARNQESAYSQTIDVYPVMDIQFGLLKIAYIDTEVHVDVSTIEVGDSLIQWTLEKNGQSVALEEYIEGSLNNEGGVIRFLEKGDYTLIASVSDEVGRIFEHKDSIKIYHLISTEFDIPGTAYTDDSLELTVNETGLGSLNIEWTLEKEGEPVNFNDYIESSLTNDGGRIRFIDKGEYVLAANVTDETGRVFKKQDSIKVFPVVETSFDLPSTAHSDETVTVPVNAKELGRLDIQWSVVKDGQQVSLSDYIDGSLDNNGGAVIFKEKGDYILKATVIDELGRVFEYSDSIKVYPVVGIAVDLPAATHTDEECEVTVNHKELGNLNIEWILEKDGQQVNINSSLEGNLSNSGGTIRFLDKGEYTLIAKTVDELGRTFEYRDNIKVYPVMSISFELPEYAHTDTSIEVHITTEELEDSNITWNLEKDGKPVQLSEYVEGTLTNDGGLVRFLDKGEFKLLASASNDLGRIFTFDDSLKTYPLPTFEIDLPVNAHIGDKIPVTIVSGEIENMSQLLKLKKEGQYVEPASYVIGDFKNGSEISFSSTGHYELEVHLTDPTGRTFVNTSSIEILNRAPEKPTISADVTRQIKNGKFLVTINVHSVDPDGDAITYEFNGKAADNYYLPGIHTVEVRAVDQYGAYSVRSSIQFNVVNNPPSTPVITRTPDTNSVSPGTQVKITAQSSDPDGDMFTYVWEGRPSEISTYPLGKNVVKVKAVDEAGATSSWTAIVFFVADAENGGGMTLTGPNSTIIENGLEGATITEYTFNVPPVSGHSGSDYGRVKGYNIQTNQWDQIDYGTTKNGIYMTKTLPAGKYSKLEFYYYTNHTCMYNKSNITYTVKYHFE